MLVNTVSNRTAHILTMLLMLCKSTTVLQRNYKLWTTI